MAGVTGVALAGGILPVTIDQKTLNEKTAMMKIVADDLASDDPDAELPPDAAWAAAGRLSDLVSPAAGDRMLADADAAGMGAEELLQRLTKTVLERALGAELDYHLGYVKGDPAGAGSGNARNGGCRT